ncbi:MAG: putative antiporter rane protein [Bacteroidetes bacterium]|nr:putative antiporter rane protein [Bacteroidota bacterium]
MSQLKATYREIWHIAYPLILGNLVYTMIGMCDTAFMGKIDNAHIANVAQAAIGPSAIFYSVLFMIGFAYTRGTQILIARKMGEGKPQEVGEIVDNAIVIMLASSLVLFALIRIFSNKLLGAMMHDKEIVEASEAFLNYRIWGILASFTSCVFISFYSGIGKTRLLTLSIGLMVVINIILNYLLVFGKWGFPEMGIAGSGLASSISEWLSVLVMVGGVFIHNRRRDFQLFNIRKLHFPLISNMTKVAVPLVIQAIIANGAWFVLFIFIEKMPRGQENLAISSILRILIIFISVPVWALGSVTNTVVSNLSVQDDLEGVKKAIHRISLMSMAMVAVQCIILGVAPRFILHLFTNDMVLIDQAVPIMWIVIVALIMLSFTVIFFNGVVSVGETTHEALYIEILTVVVYFLYFDGLFHIPGITLPYIWTAEWVYWLVMLGGSVFMLRRKKVHLF